MSINAALHVCLDLSTGMHDSADEVLGEVVCAVGV